MEEKKTFFSVFLDYQKIQSELKCDPNILRKDVSTFNRRNYNHITRSSSYQFWEQPSGSSEHIFFSVVYEISNVTQPNSMKHAVDDKIWIISSHWKSDWLQIVRFFLMICESSKYKLNWFDFTHETRRCRRPWKVKIFFSSYAEIWKKHMGSTKHKLFWCFLTRKFIW